MTLQPVTGPTPARLPEHESWTRIYEPLIDLAGRLAQSPFAPEGMRGDTAGVFSVLLAGHGLALSPIQSLQSIVLIKGKPYVSTDVILGLAFRAGHTVQWGACTDKTATVRVTRGDGHGSAEVTYTMAQAKAAGLTGKTNWQRMPAEMLRARAVRAALKMVAADLALGLEAAENPTVTAATVPGSDQVTVMQLEQHPNPQPELEDEPHPADTEEPEPEHEEPERLTVPQRNKIGALIGALETANGARLSRDERRAFIGSLIDVPDLGSANDLTRGQASAVIDALTDLVADLEDSDAETDGDDDGA